MELVYRRKTKTEWLTLYVFSLPFLFFLLMGILGFPELVKYTIDIAWVCLLFCMLNRRDLYLDRHTGRLAAIIGIFFAISCVGFLSHYQSVWYYLWGIRNNARFFVFFFACIFFLNRKSVEYYVKSLDVIFWINIPLTLFQFFALGKSQDYLGGVFGYGKGCNGYTNILLMIVVARAVLNWLNKKESGGSCLAKCAAALLVAVLAELKVFFLEFMLIVILAMYLTKRSFRKLWLTMGVAAGILCGAQLIQVLFPDFSDWFTLEKIWRNVTAAKGYTGTGDMNRLTAVSIALSRFLQSGWDKIFGLGLGNCDYASFEFLTTPFYQKYGALNYTFFSSAYLVLETGIVGLGLYVFFFVFVYKEVRTIWKKDAKKTEYCQLAMIMSVMCLFLILYNSSLRTEAGFMMYFVLALPFLKGRQEEQCGMEEA